MKKKYIATLLVLMMLAAMTVTTFIYFSYKNALAGTDNDTGIIVPDKEPDYHFVMNCENLSDPFWISLKKGVERASKEFNVAVEFNGPIFPNPEEEARYFNIAVASKVDAIATHVWNEKEGQQLIDQAVAKKIPVVTIDADAKNSMRSAFIGANAYDLGMQLGKMLVAASYGKASAAVLINTGTSNETANLIISGIQFAIANYPQVKIEIINISDSKFAGVEDAVGDLLSLRTDLDSIICTTAKDTESVVQRLVDLNKVGRTVVGFGDSPPLLNYIDKGVIYGTVASNAEQMGYDAIKALVDLKKHGRTSAYYPTDIKIITKQNVAQYLSPEVE